MKTCTCDFYEMLRKGCTCGAMAEEKSAKAAQVVVNSPTWKLNFNSGFGVVNPTAATRGSLRQAQLACAQAFDGRLRTASAYTIASGFVHDFYSGIIGEESNEGKQVRICGCTIKNARHTPAAGSNLNCWLWSYYALSIKGYRTLPPSGPPFFVAQCNTGCKWTLHGTACAAFFCPHCWAARPGSGTGVIAEGHLPKCLGNGNF